MKQIELIKEARELMENTHSYDSQVARKIDITLKGIENGKTYDKSFLNDLLENSLYLFENTHSDETKTYEKIDTFLDGD